MPRSRSGSTEPPGGAGDLLFAATIIIAGPVLLGRLMRSRVKLNQALQREGRGAEQDRDARAADAVTGERERIAGELHHVVSEALASMVGQAGTAEELSRSRPDGAEPAFAAVEETGREALGEIRRLLGVLRREDEELALAPQPSLAHLADLVARAHASGLAVELDVEGERSPLPAGVDLTAYRLVQEALGGALEAPDARRAAVRVRYAGDELALEVTDDGESPPAGDRAAARHARARRAVRRRPRRRARRRLRLRGARAAAAGAGGVMRPRTLDIALTATVLVLSVTEALLSDGVTGPRWATALVSSAMCLLLLWRRTHPARDGGGAAASSRSRPPPALFDSSELISTFLPLLILAYSGARLRRGARRADHPRARAVRGRRRGRPARREHDASDIYFPAIITTLCWLGGRTVGTRARHAAELHETAALAAERRERETQEAVAEERRRIAREMHDVVAHSISMMVIQAGGARRILATDPGRAEEAAARIRSAGTDALAEMDILLGVLEAAPDGTAPPKLDGLGELVERAREAGLPVTLEVNGERAAAQRGRRARRLPRRAGGADQRRQARGRRDDRGAARVGRRRARAERRRPRRRRREPAARRAPGTGSWACASGCACSAATCRRARAPDGGFEVAARLPLERRPAGVS